MGHGSYTASDWAKLKASRSLGSTSNAGAIFSGNKYQDKYDPYFIEKRESCDSQDSPESTPIIIAFDCTGSMGYLAEEIAKNSLNETIMQLYDKQPVPNPHVMCAAFSNPTKNGLQVTQFEADIRVVEQLLDLVIGDGNLYSYDSLVWYFAAKHTEIDSFNKRGKKGYLFCIGDEICGYKNGEVLTDEEIKTVFNDNSESLPLEKVYQMASEKYEVFHIVTGWRLETSCNTWEEFIPGRVARISANNIGYLYAVITSLMQLSQKSKDEIIKQWDDKTRAVVEEALQNISLPRT